MVGGETRGDERRPHRARRDGVDADALVGEVFGERARPADDGSLGSRVVNQLFRPRVRDDGRRADDRTARLQVGEGGARRVEVRVNVDFEDVVKLLVADVRQTRKLGQDTDLPLLRPPYYTNPRHEPRYPII